MSNIKLTLYSKEDKNSNQRSTIQCAPNNQIQRIFKKPIKEHSSKYKINQSWFTDNITTFWISATKPKLNTTFKTIPTCTKIQQQSRLNNFQNTSPSNILKYSHQLPHISPNHRTYTSHIQSSPKLKAHKSISPVKVHANNVFNDKANWIISQSINKIIDWKSKNTFWKMEQSSLLSQKQEIINHYENTILNLQHEIMTREKPKYDNERYLQAWNTWKEELETVYTEKERIHSQIVTWDDQILNMNRKYSTENEEFEQATQAELEDWNELIKKKLLILTENDINTINLMLRIVLISILDLTENDIVNHIFNTNPPETINGVIGNLLKLLNNNNPKNKRLLKSYFLKTSNNDIQIIKDTFYNTISNSGTVNHNSTTNQNYANCVISFYSASKDKMISCFKEADRNNSNVISFQDFLQILMDHTGNIALSNTIFEYIIYIMKGDCYHGKYYLLDLSYMNLVNLWWNNGEFVEDKEREEDYKNAIFEYWYDNKVDFNDLISECNPGVVYDKDGKRYLRVGILSMWLKRKGIIGKNKMIPRTGELMKIDWDEINNDYEVFFKQKVSKIFVEDVFNSVFKRLKQEGELIIEPA